MPRFKKYGHIDDWVMEPVSREMERKYLLGHQSTPSGALVVPKGNPRYVSDYRIIVYQLLREEHGIDITDVPPGVKRWIDSKIKEYREKYRRSNPDRDLSPGSYSRTEWGAWKRYDPEEVADLIAEDLPNA